MTFLGALATLLVWATLAVVVFVLVTGLIGYAASRTWAIHIHVHHHCAGDDPEGDEAELPDDDEAATDPKAGPDARVN